MKAKVIATGEIVDVYMYDYPNTIGKYKEKSSNSSARIFYASELDFKSPAEYQKTINWEQRRFELAKSALNGLLSKGDYYEDDHIGTAKDAIKYADAVIAKLKEE